MADRFVMLSGMKPRSPPPAGPRHGVARVLSKQGVCSRSEAIRRVLDGRVRVNGRVVRDPEFGVRQGVDVVAVDDAPLVAAEPLFVMLNKPRGLVTSTADERGRETVYRCFDGAGLPWLAPVGRLDRASEGLLLFCNDPAWAAGITDPATGPDKTYHVQIDRHADDALLAQLEAGVRDGDEWLAAGRARRLREGERTAWLELMLDEGRNRHIRRLLAAFDIEVRRLVRVAIGPLALGELPKGHWRRLTAEEVGWLTVRR